MVQLPSRILVVQGLGVSGSIAWLRVRPFSPGFHQETSWMMLDTISMAVPKRDTPTFGGSWKVTKTKIQQIERLHRMNVMKSYNVIMRIYMFHLILNENCRNPLYIILEYILFVLFKRIPCNMNMDPYWKDHSEIPTYASNQPICVLLRCFFPYSNVVQPLLRSSFGIKSTCRRLWGLHWNCCYWWIYVVWLLYSCIYPHIQYPRLIK